MNPLKLVDYYKTEHHLMMPPGTSKLYSNFTPRKSRLPGVGKVVFFGMQYFILTYLIEAFDYGFFKTSWIDGIGQRRAEMHELRKEVMDDYKKHIHVDTKHLEALWDLGYLPIEIKAVEEGTLVPIGVPCFTITNTLPEFSWLVNYLETLISCCMWQPITSATIAYEYKKLFTKWALKTTGDASFVQWQGHDFSMRGMSSPESAILSGMGHLLSFTGTDTIPAIYQLEESYDGEGLIGASVPATEHSIQCMHYDFATGAEDAYIKHLLKTYPTGIVSMVSDGFNLWDVITKTLPKHKDKILARDGKLVIRPDSGDPVDILCGTVDFTKNIPGYTILGAAMNLETMLSITEKGVIELLWDIFGGTIVKGNDGKEYKQLDSHIGAIYGDSITLDRAQQICERLAAKGFSSTNVVLGIGSFTYQYNTRDTFGFAMKATYGEVTTMELDAHGPGVSEWSAYIERKEIYKDPITDDGTKKSKKGLLAVFEDANHTGVIFCKDQCTPEEEKTGLLKTVFKDGKLVRRTNLAEIRAKLVI